jgi:hypothetical protein
VTVSTTDGDVTLRRSTVAPLPAAPQNPPIFTRAPTAPATASKSHHHNAPAQDGTF